MLRCCLEGNDMFFCFITSRDIDYLRLHIIQTASRLYLDLVREQASSILN